MKTLLMLLLALAMPVRAQDYPNKPVRVVVPYVAGGNAGFDMSQWQGVLAPAGTPRPIVERLNGAIVKAMHAPDVHERIAVQGGNDIVTGTPENSPR
jgi:tripartite-type tricarboxylate transporter receptor subunit TctC